MTRVPFLIFSSLELKGAKGVKIAPLDYNKTKKEVMLIEDSL